MDTANTTPTTPALDEPTCALCGGPLIPGLNTDFCSLACEEAFFENEKAYLDYRAEERKE